MIFNPVSGALLRSTSPVTPGASKVAAASDNASQIPALQEVYMTNLRVELSTMKE
jgi:hypothetical protein